MEKPGTIHQSMHLIIAIIIGIFCGFLMGISFPKLRAKQFEMSPIISLCMEDKPARHTTHALMNTSLITANIRTSSHKTNNYSKIYIPANPRGAETLPPGIVNAESDFYLRRLWGKPSEDLTFKQKYLVTFTVGVNQKKNIDAAVKKYRTIFLMKCLTSAGRICSFLVISPFCCSIMMVKQAIGMSLNGQSMQFMWYVKRFLHPDIVAAYDYIFIWDEDLGVEHFDAEEYIKLVNKHGLEISQPGLETKGYISWKLTKRKPDGEVHKEIEERPGWCSDPHFPPCAAFVEIMAPVFSRKAWRCIWYMIQSDLVHGWGLDLAVRRCVQPAHEKIGIVDSQWVIHQLVPTLGDQGKAVDGKKPWQGVRQRCNHEWEIFRRRVRTAETKYYKDKGLTPPNATYGR